MSLGLPVLNLAEAKFECTFGRGCEGLCCRNGQPGLYPDEVETLAANQERFLPHLRPEARAAIQREGHLQGQHREELPMLRVVEGWCVFFNQGCVLHQVGAREGDYRLYKPAMCLLFPLARTLDDDWYVRQWGYQTEEWDLFCLNPAASAKPAAESLHDEIALAEHYSREE